MTAVTAVIAAATAVVIAPTAATVVTVKSVLRSVVFVPINLGYTGAAAAGRSRLITAATAATAVIAVTTAVVARITTAEQV